MTRPIHSSGTTSERTSTLQRNLMESRCPACFSRDCTPVDHFAPRDEAPWRVVRCANCGQMFTNPRPKPEDWHVDYPDSYPPHKTRRDRLRLSTRWRRQLECWVLQPTTDAEMGFLGPAHRWPGLVTRRRLRPLLDARFAPVHGDGRLLDIGCGNGTYLARMLRLGWKVTGIDRSSLAIARANSSDGVSALVAEFPSPNVPRGPYDLITAWEVLEHLDRPRSALREVRRLLANGGRLMVSVPNQAGWAASHFGPAWAGLDLPRHLTHFTIDSLAAMLESEGLRPRYLSTISHAGWIRRSARNAQRMGLGWSKRLLVSKTLSRLAASRARANDAGESIFVMAERA